MFRTLAIALTLLALPLGTQAQRPAPVEAQLASDDPSIYAEGLSRFAGAKRKRPAWWKALSERIARGMSPELLETTISAIAESGSAQCEGSLDVLLRHRRPEIRKQALDALVLCAPKAAGPALQEGLDDLDNEVRASAALALGQVQYHDAVPSLFAALDLGLLEAVFGLAQNIKAEEADRFLAYLGKVPLDTMGQAVSALLSRTDLPVKTRLEAISKLEAMATPQAQSVLASFVELYESDRKHKATVTLAKAAISRLTTGN